MIRVIIVSWLPCFYSENICNRTVYCTFFLIIVKSLQFRKRRQIAEPRKYCLVHLITFFGVCFLYFFCFSQVGISVKFPTAKWSTGAARADGGS